MTWRCECWHNPETGQRECCPEHEAEVMDLMMEIEAKRQRAFDLLKSGASIHDAALASGYPKDAVTQMAIYSTAIKAAIAKAEDR